MYIWAVIDKGLKTIQYLESNDDLNCIAGVEAMLQEKYKMPTRMDTQNRFTVVFNNQSRECPYKKYVKYKTID